MTEYGGCEAFYTDFYMNFVCPLGIVRMNAKGNEVNCNYYENKKLQEALKPIILESLQNQIDCGIDTSVCYCIGSGENFKFLSKINEEHHFLIQSYLWNIHALLCNIILKIKMYTWKSIYAL